MALRPLALWISLHVHDAEIGLGFESELERMSESHVAGLREIGRMEDPDDRSDGFS
jgi:hypothetical protein